MRLADELASAFHAIKADTRKGGREAGPATKRQSGVVSSNKVLKWGSQNGHTGNIPGASQPNAIFGLFGC